MIKGKYLVKYFYITVIHVTKPLESTANVVAQRNYNENNKLLYNKYVTNLTIKILFSIIR